MRIKKGDKVRIIAGKAKGQEGIVKQAFPKQERVIIEGVLLATKHVKPSQHEEGKIIQKESSIHISNVALVDPKTKTITTKIGYKTEDGRKVRYAKRSGEKL